jgi:hypothetical protein
MLPLARSRAFGPQFVEAMAWASTGGAFIGLSQHGAHPTAILYLAAPLACSLVIRRSGLSTTWLAIVCTGIVLAGIVSVALLGALVRW